MCISKKEKIRTNLKWNQGKLITRETPPNITSSSNIPIRKWALSWSLTCILKMSSWLNIPIRKLIKFWSMTCTVKLSSRLNITIRTCIWSRSLDSSLKMSFRLYNTFRSCIWSWSLTSTLKMSSWFGKNLLADTLKPSIHKISSNVCILICSFLTSHEIFSVDFGFCSYSSLTRKQIILVRTCGISSLWI